MNISSVLYVAVRLAGPIMLVAMGGLMARKVNIFNLALEGFMLVACFASILGAHLCNNTWWGMLFGVIASVIFILIYAVFILELKVQPIICAIAVITVVSGLTRFLVRPVFGTSGRFELSSSLAVPTFSADWLKNIPIVGPILNGQSILILFALICPVILYYVLYKTGLGLKIRAVGLDEEAAMAAGIHVKKIKYIALILNGIFCGLGGAQLALSVYMFNINMTDGRGFIGLASVTLAGGRPILAGLAALLFGFAEAVQLNLSKYGVSSYLLEMIPYVMAIVAAILPFLVQVIANKTKRGISEKKIISRYYKNLET